jgi:hypothetical protein
MDAVAAMAGHDNRLVEPSDPGALASPLGPPLFEPPALDTADDTLGAPAGRLAASGEMR